MSSTFLVCQSALQWFLLRHEACSSNSDGLVAHIILDENEALVQGNFLDGHRLNSARVVLRSIVSIIHENVVDNLGVLLASDLVACLHELGAHGKTLLHSFNVVEIVTSLEESGRVRDSLVGNIGLLVFPIDEVLSPILPLFLASSRSSRSITGG